MGEVYRARDTRLDRDVAIKVLPPHLAAATRACAQRFEREARAVSALNHPHICTLYDVGQQDGIDYLVMEYLEGETLAERLAEGRRCRSSEALRHRRRRSPTRWTRRTAQGIVHRDLKPGNVMLTKTGAEAARLRPGAKRPEPAGVAGARPRHRRRPRAQPLTAEGTIARHVPVHGAGAARGQGGRRAHRHLRVRAPCSTRWLTGQRGVRGQEPGEPDRARS